MFIVFLFPRSKGSENFFFFRESSLGLQHIKEAPHGKLPYVGPVGLLWNTGKVVGLSRHRNTKLTCLDMYYYFCVIFVALVLPPISVAHIYHENPSDNAPYMSRFSQVPGVMVR